MDQKQCGSSGQNAKAVDPGECDWPWEQEQTKEEEIWYVEFGPFESPIPSVLGGALKPMPEQTRSERHFPVNLPEGAIRRLAKLSPEANRKLRQQVPDAFLGEPVTGAELLNLVYPEISGAHKGMGLHLASAYSWEIIPLPNGTGSTLVARKKL